ncbi:hypothetical protein K445DRAFT_11236 [Daldinia sp. EC12]|nr:hypothetical protein K445DRAFT_11236 [Daldinia sp. EC12]
MSYRTILWPPVRTAKELRFRFGEPEPREHKRATSESISRQNNQTTGLSTITKRGNQGATFDNLPYELKASIFDMVSSSPGWAYFKFRKGKLVECWGGDQAIYVNREWYESRELRQGLSTIKPSISRPVGVEALAEGILHLFSGDEHGSGSQGRHRNNKHSEYVTVRKDVDWFFFDGSVDQMTGRDHWDILYHLNGVRFCAFKLDEVFDGTLASTDLDPPPSFMWPRSQCIEELIIVVGRFRKEVPPSGMRVIQTFQADRRSVEVIKNKAYNSMLESGNPEWTQYLAESEKKMIGDISRIWSRKLFKKYQWRQEWLESEDGRLWLDYPVHDKRNEISMWLATSEGYDWLGYDWRDEDQPGFQFLASKSGWWWLASDFGSPWLETEQGIAWLDSREGQEFLTSPQALLWANTGTYTSSEFTPLGPQVRKAWFSTPAGREWQFHNCPNGAPPRAPRPPCRESTPTPDRVFPNYFLHRHFRAWRFVICPEEIAERTAGHQH